MLFGAEVKLLFEVFFAGLVLLKLIGVVVDGGVVRIGSLRALVEVRTVHEVSRVVFVRSDSLHLSLFVAICLVN